MVLREEMIRRGPLRVLERSLGGGLAAGEIGVVTARKGVGKTAFLVGIGLDEALRGRKVLHVTLKRSVEQVTRYYDEIFAALARSRRLEDHAESRMAMERHRHIISYRDGDLSIGRIGESLDFLAEHAGFAPDVIILNGFPDFESGDPELPRIMLDLRELARARRLPLWINALRHREGQERDERDVPVSVARCDEAIAVILRLEPRADHVRLRIVKDRDAAELPDLRLELDPATLLLRWR